MVELLPVVEEEWFGGELLYCRYLGKWLNYYQWLRKSGLVGNYCIVDTWVNG
jgi:hypothetical protein